MPIKGFEEIPGYVWKELEESGHGRRLVIADRSLAISKRVRKNNTVLEQRGWTSPQAFRRVLQLTTQEGPLTVMDRDPGDNSELSDVALCQFTEIAVELGVAGSDILAVPRKGEFSDDGIGFYDIINDIAEDKLFIRTGEFNPYGCETHLFGHSQIGAESS